MKYADIDSWQNLPMPEEVAELEYKAEYSADEFERISRGLIPREMEDKWFIFFQGKTLQLHRSWTGFCVYHIEFAKVDGKHVVQRALVNRNQDQYDSSDNEYDARLLHFLVANMLLGQNEPFPVPADTSNDELNAILQYQFSGIPFSED